MEEEREVARYWCHGCSQIVDPILEVETIKCSLCRSEFVEEMESIRNDHHHHHHHHHHHLESDLAGASDSDSALSLWAPILLGMTSNPRRRRRFRQIEFDDEDEDEDHHDHNEGRPQRYRHREGETELDRELESIMRRRRRSSATILQLLQGIRAGMASESEGNIDSDIRDRDGDGRRENRDRERVILINPFDRTIIVHVGSFDSSNPQNPVGSLGDYFVGPGLELLLQHLAENDPNRYGTPPAQKEAVEAMPTVKVQEKCLQCSVCLEDFEIDSEAKEMPCKHRFHSECIFPWLELHSSCPVCRYQLPSDESKLGLDREQGRAPDHDREPGGSRNSVTENLITEANHGNGEAGDGDERNDSGRQFSVSLPWPFSSLFSSSGPQTANTISPSSIQSSSSRSSANADANTREGASRSRDD